ncbi:glycosyltransferase family 2 protein [Geomobilimonas luticola]|uniref:Glycosyltransferase n=1 Tax=Geomobilimonas luticola TaxID=1114878 RepID=A0ABS5SH02_9BACT|nr:glycosyltransferase family 2 protein [Geomobilimonas luticola]MBT0653789.1 glycosyltransferase [Geomobilimonas luticola]
MPLVSIVTSVFNDGQHLEKTIRSVISQSYECIEYIIIDGGSRDETLDILSTYADKIDYWVSEPDRGIYDAWNKALSVANGEWIAFLGSGDIYLDDAVGEYIRYIQNSACEREFVSARIEITNPVTEKGWIFGDAWNWQEFKKNMTVAHPGAFHNRRLFQRYGMFDASYRIAGDYELLLRAREKLRTGFLDTVTVQMLGDGASTNLEVFRENYRAKTVSGGRNRFICYLEEKRKWWSIAKHHIPKSCSLGRNQ